MLQNSVLTGRGSFVDMAIARQLRETRTLLHESSGNHDGHRMITPSVEVMRPPASLLVVLNCTTTRYDAHRVRHAKGAPCALRPSRGLPRAQDFLFFPWTWATAHSNVKRTCCHLVPGFSQHSMNSCAHASKFSAVPRVHERRGDAHA